jgi:sugar phosphate isomerase/epimerase
LKKFEFRVGIQPDVNHSLRKAFEFARENDFDHLELLMDHPEYHFEAVSAAEILELKGIFEVDVLFHASSTSTNFLSISSEMRKASYRELERTINFARKCGAELVTFHLGWNPGFITSEGFIFKKEWYSKHNYRVITDEMIPFLKTVDTSLLALENTIEMDDRTEEALKLLFSNTDINLTLDIGHSNLRGHELFWNNFERVINIHLHDNSGDYDRHLPLGRGSVNIDRIDFSTYNGFLTFELRNEKAILESKSFFEDYLSSRYG